jgi:hypothetical protein
LRVGNPRPERPDAAHELPITFSRVFQGRRTRASCFGASDLNISPPSPVARNPSRKARKMGRIWKFYSNWQQEFFACAACGWTGKVGFEDLDVGDVAAIIECPKCYCRLGVVLYPNLEDTKAAAAEGNREAIQELPGLTARIEKNWELLDRFELEKIYSVDQLPDLKGESLEFYWDLVRGEDGEWYQSIQLGEAEVWRELAFFNNLRRFEEIKGLLKTKYGVRFKSLTPTPKSIEWLSGDNLGRALQIIYA